ncbi:MAG TPA: LON peptidase substrate-binding domain-containing protein, partial [Solirubrobacterales bacterium]
METLTLIPIEETVVFPGMSATLAIDVGEDERVFLVPRSEEHFASVGTVARVAERMRIPGGGNAVTLEGLHRGVAGPAAAGAEGGLRVEVTEHADDSGSERADELAREYRAVVEEILELREADPRIGAFLRSIVEPGALADTAGYSPDLSFEQKRELLETLDVTERLEKAVAAQRERLAELQVRRRIRDDVESGAQKQQRDYFLRKQLESIRKELGEDEGDVIDDYRRQIDEAGMSDEVREQAERELGRLERMGESGEASMIRTYLDWLLAVPWGERSEE